LNLACRHRRRRAPACRVQLDDGFDSQDSGIVRGDAAQIVAHAVELIKKHKTDVVLQPLLAGREWTVAIAAGEPMAPVQVRLSLMEIIALIICFVRVFSLLVKHSNQVAGNKHIRLRQCHMRMFIFSQYKRR
jgi:hypothetical protein